jgi:hypothetical protein
VGTAPAVGAGRIQAMTAARSVSMAIRILPYVWSSG